MPQTHPLRPGPFRLDTLTVHPDRNEIEDTAGARRLEPMSMRLLTLLAEAAPRTVTRDSIVERLWSGRVVTDEAVAKQISKLRAALGDSDRDTPLLQTVAKVGVRLTIQPEFVAPKALGGVRWPRGAGWIGAAAAALLAAAGGAAWLARDGEAGAVTITPLTAAPGVETRPALSPDGSWLAWAGRAPGETGFAIHVRLTREETARRLTPQGVVGQSPAWSADGRLAFVVRDAQGCAIAVGSPVGDYTRVAACVSADVGGLAWDGPDRLLVSDHEGVGRSFRIAAIDLRNGRRRVLTHPPAGVVGDTLPAARPGGGGPVYFLRTQTLGPAALYRLDPAAGTQTRLTEAMVRPAGLAALADGSVLLVAARDGGMAALWRFTPGRNRWRQVAPGPVERFGAAADGRSVAVSRSSSDVALVRAPATGGPGLALAASTGVEWSPVLSPDGRSIAFISDRSGSPELWVSALAGGTPRRVTTLNAADLQDPAWSPDGRTLAFAAPVDGQFEIFAVDAAGGAVRRLFRTREDERHPAFTPDGRGLYFSRRGGARHRLMRRELSTGRETVAAEGGVRALPTPDGRALYYGKAFEAGLHRLDLATGRSVRITAWPSWPGLRNWTLADGRVWGVDGAGEAARLMTWDPASAAAADIGPLPGLNRRSGVAIREGEVIYARLEGVESDLELIRLKR